MNDEQREQSSRQPRNKAELVARIRRSRLALEETLASLSEAQLAAHGPAQWAIKDHLAHLAAWELGIAELLRRRSRFAAMGVAEAVAQDKSEEEINEVIYRRHAGLAPAEALETFHAAHRQLLEALDALSDEDLFRPYAFYAPEEEDAPQPEAEDAPQAPVLNWIVGNTYEHFDEHNGYIRAMLGNDSGAR
jgi:hypothetical protein